MRRLRPRLVRELVEVKQRVISGGWGGGLFRGPRV